jgi:hypothetical protein
MDSGYNTEEIYRLIQMFSDLAGSFREIMAAVPARISRIVVDVV